MSITYQSASTLAYGSTSVAANYPASLAAGNSITLIVGTKPDTATINTPAGFIKLYEFAGGAGTTGVDTGPTKIAGFWRRSTGSESGTISVSISSGNSSWAQMYRHSNATGLWNVGADGGVDTSAGTAWSVTCGANPGITSGDHLLVGSCIPTDVTTPSQFASESISATGATLGSMSEISEPDSSTGNDIGGFVFRMQCSAGTASAAPVVTATASGTTTNVSGPTILVRLREVAAHSQTYDDFEGGSNGSNYTNASGLASDGGGAASCTYSTAAAMVGSLGVRIVSASQNLNRHFQMPAAETNVMGFGHILIKCNALPTAIISIGQLKDTSVGNTFSVLRWNTDGTFTIRDNNTNRATSSTALPTNGDILQIMWGVLNGLVVMRIYDAGGTLLEDESTLNGTYSGASIVNPRIAAVNWGTITSSGTLTLDFDNVGWSTDDWPTPFVLSTTYAAAGTVTATSGAAGDAHITYGAAGTVALATTVTGDPVGIKQAAGTTAAVSAVSGDATKVIPQAAGQVDLATTVAGTVTARLQALGVSAATTAVTGTITSKLQAAGVIAASAATSGAITVIMPAAGVVTATSGVSGDATLVVGNQAAGTVVCTSGVVGNASLVAKAAGTVPAVVTVAGDATRVPIVYSAAGTVAGVTGVSGDATRVLQTLAAAGTVAVVSTTAGNATRVLQTLAAAGTSAATTTVTGDATRVPIVYAAAGVVAAVATVSGDASIVIPPTPGGPGLLVPLSPDRDRDLARR